jgi:hypothetical protein
MTREQTLQRTREAREDCERCNATARAIQIVIARWIVAGIDKGE